MPWAERCLLTHHRFRYNRHIHPLFERYADGSHFNVYFVAFVLDFGCYVKV